MQESLPITYEVEKGAIRRFAEAIGGMNPIYHDESCAVAKGYRSLVAPPTFPITFRYQNVPGLELPEQGLIHAEQSFELGVPIVAGDRITCTTRLVDDYVKEGRSGRMRFVVREVVGVNQFGETAFRSRSSVIVREGVSGSG